ncbi:TIGR04211 family SH3 domain-containing protein [Sediminicurvatus halobius]|uniref:TIGR04211 family SH3 domain-containing protein n=1 Tax=Sediminicurvatus halobius TaxID=2182432 RepID=UPI001304F6E2|nr:TIGR04211 family SH3 domain-containing protein [Spiribacter halobius]UEX77493.1 TIGR04211 family SH3 domain-containing protein [Spiribacter halobius]
MQGFFKALLFAVLFGVVGAAGAQSTAYVTDELRLNLRSGPGNEYRILQLLPSGTPVQVLERGNEWTRVRSGGNEGWMRTSYLQSQPAAAVRLEEATEELARLREQNAGLQEALEATRVELESTVAEVQSLRDENEAMSRRLEQASEGLELADENQALKKQVIDLEREVQDLTNETRRLSDRSRQDWFVVGAGVMAFGMLVGIIVTRIRWRRRSSWGDL